MGNHAHHERNMKTIAVEPYWDKLVEYHRDHAIELGLWEWIQQEYRGYQVFVVSNPSAVGEKEGCGLLFGDDEDATLFALRWT